LDDGVAKRERQIPSTVTPNPNGLPVRPSAAPASVSGSYRGTARADGAKAVPKPATKPPNATSSSSQAIKTERRPATAPAPPPPAAALQAAGPPKKGSYQEILARAKAAQQAKPLTGTIKHKQMERVTRKERLAAQEAAKAKHGPSRNGKAAERSRPEERIKAGDRSRTGSSEPAARKAGETSKEKRKPLDLGYKGTMRPLSAEPQYKGTMGLARPGQARKPTDARRGGQIAPRGARYASYSEEEDEEEEDYDSDASSDMEAGAFDVEREEMLALKAAKHDDAKEAAMEAELKRQKERRKMLAKMAAEKSKKKPIY
jgi:protein SPT2